MYINKIACFTIKLKQISTNEPSRGQFTTADNLVSLEMHQFFCFLLSIKVLKLPLNNTCI